MTRASVVSDMLSSKPCARRCALIRHFFFDRRPLFTLLSENHKISDVTWTLSDFWRGVHFAIATPPCLGLRLRGGMQMHSFAERATLVSNPDATQHSLYICIAVRRAASARGASSARSTLDVVQSSVAPSAARFAHVLHTVPAGWDRKCADTIEMTRASVVLDMRTHPAEHRHPAHVIYGISCVH
ncbi:hypothetical protein DFH11DRAFT_1295363 [Phellopilus nigrolimitatus]|nr:hypothetical protein DFH11DRAFT_1295363 [Phellopilus nigrolimitatus]